MNYKLFDITVSGQKSFVLPPGMTNSDLVSLDTFNGWSELWLDVASASGILKPFFESSIDGSRFAPQSFKLDEMEGMGVLHVQSSLFLLPPSGRVKFVLDGQNTWSINSVVLYTLENPIKDSSTLKTLLSRSGLIAADSGSVIGPAKRINGGERLYIEAVYEVSGSLNSVEVRLAIEGSLDGVNWNELVRFPDGASISGEKRVVRMGRTGSDLILNLQPSDLSTTSVGVVNPGELPPFVRGVSKLQSIGTGGGSVTMTVTTEVK